jgi:hypothetical protein
MYIYVSSYHQPSSQTDNWHWKAKEEMSIQSLMAITLTTATHRSSQTKKTPIFILNAQYTESPNTRQKEYFCFARTEETYNE